MKMHRFVLASALWLLAGLAQAAPAADRLESLIGPQPLLYIEQDGVALSAFPSRERLSTQVRIGLARPHRAVSWSAVSDADWLSVTPSGKTGDRLTLSASPGELSMDSLHLATVTVSTTSGFVKESRTIRVSLWLGSTDPGIQNLTDASGALETNPVEPWVYVAANAGASVRVYNVYDGTLLKTFDKVAPTVGEMHASSDGRTLFVTDTTNYRILALDATSGALLRDYTLQGPISAYFSFAYARPQGKSTLFAVGQTAIDVASGKAVSPVLDSTQGYYSPSIAVTPDGTRLAILERGLSPGSVYTFSVARTSGTLAYTQLATARLDGSNCQDMSISADGTRVYPACGAPYQFNVYDVATMAQVQTLAANTYPNNTEIDADGNFVGGLNGLYNPADVYVYNTSGFLIGSVPEVIYAQSQINAQMKVSGDCSRVISGISGYNGSTLLFRSMP